MENELAKKDEIIKTLLETQTSNLETVSEQKNRGNAMTENHYLVKKKKKKPKNPQKTIFIGSLRFDIKIDDLYELLGLGSTKYLRETY